MRRASFTIIDGGNKVSEVDANVSEDTVCLSFGGLKTALGWEHKPEGLCKGDVCVPLRDEIDLISDGGVDLTSFGELFMRPLALDTKERVAYLGEAVSDRYAQLQSLEAPDFSLPDLDGQPHSLSDYLGKKVLLIAYASW